MTNINNLEEKLQFLYQTQNRFSKIIESTASVFSK